MIEAAALEYVARATPVFPVVPGKKVPLIAGGRNAASTDPDQVRAWWLRWPEAGIGVPTGPESGWAVLDVDRRAGGLESLRTLVGREGRPPEGPRQRTRSGGWHLVFAYPDAGVVRSRAGRLGAGLDTRGRGGYVVVAPTPGYRWIVAPWALEPPPAPAWLVEHEAEVRPTAPPVDFSGYGDGTRYGLAALGRACRRVAEAAEGQRHDELVAATLAMGNLVGGGELAAHAVRAGLLHAGHGAGLPEREVEAVLAWALPVGVARPRQARGRAA